jgi:hypothetical protein
MTALNLLSLATFLYLSTDVMLGASKPRIPGWTVSSKSSHQDCHCLFYLLFDSVAISFVASRV